MPQSFRSTFSPGLAQTGLLIITALALALVLLSRALVPTVNPVSVLAAGLILLCYAAALMLRAPSSRAFEPSLRRWTGIAGLLCGLILGGEILLEYIVVPQDNTTWGLVEFGSVFVVLFLTGLVVGYRTGHARQALAVSIYAAMLGSLIWLIVLLSTYYVFRGTPLQEQIFRAEGTYADFAQSGMRDFAAFAIEDLLGGCFFHLLLAPIVAAILGGVGGLGGKGAARLTR